MNPLGGHAGSYHGHSLAEALNGITAAGFRFVELTSIRGVLEQIPLDASVSELHEVRELLGASGLKPVSLSGHSDLTTPNGIADARRALRICERLEIPILTTAVGGAFNENEDEDAFLSHIQPVAADALAMSVKIALEIHGTLTGSGQLTRRVVERVNHPAVGIAYDTANCEYYAGVRAETDLPAVVPYVIHCHLKDAIGGKRNWNFPPLGEGNVQFDYLLTALQNGKYSGAFTVEIEFDGKQHALDEVNKAMTSSYSYLQNLGLS